MLFVEPRFVLCFLVVLGVYWGLRGRRARKLWLLAASYGFYATFDARFLALLLASTLVDYGVGIGLGRAEGPRTRRLLICSTLVANLGMLAYFKYVDFFAESVAEVLSALGLHASWTTLHVVLPVGISFYTFQTLSYSIDVYRRKLEPTRSLLDVALYVGFFPQLAAGPIVRAIDFLPQTRRDHRWAEVDVRAAVAFLLVGYVQKAVVADNLAPVVATYFDDPGSFGSGAAWLGSLLFWVQIYGDFAGYSNMAIGLAGLLGYGLPRNFDFPFLAHNAAEFWSRWHMTLSSWINDYVIRPLRRPGQGWARHGFNVVFAMTLFGLWHGAAWKFVVWGALNGVTVVAYRTWRRRTRGRRRGEAGRVTRAASTAATLAVVTLTVSLFRASDLGDGLLVMRSMLGFAGGSEHLSAFAGRLGEPGLALLLLGLLAVHRLSAHDWTGVLRRLPAPALAAAYGIAVPLVWALAASALQPFYYFRF